MNCVLIILALLFAFAFGFMVASLLDGGGE